MLEDKSWLCENHAKSIITLSGENEEIVQVKEGGTYREPLFFTELSIPLR